MECCFCSNITMEIADHKKRVDRLKTEQRLLLRTKQELEQYINEKEKVVDDLTKARWVLSEVLRITQEKFTGYVENLVTMAIQAIWDRKTKFIARFEIKRNKSECQLLVQEGDGEPFVPKDEDGGGLVDVISTALRVVLWSLEKPRSRNVLLLDEPFKNVGNLLPRAGQMLKDISEKLGIQLIINTHDKALMDIADRSWTVTHRDGTSTVRLAVPDNRLEYGEVGFEQVHEKKKVVRRKK